MKLPLWRQRIWAPLLLLVLSLPLTLVACAADRGAQPLGCAAGTSPCLSGTAVVALDTSRGRVLLRLDGNNAPLTAGNFVDLVRRGAYNGTVFHRVVREPVPFVVQGGDPASANPKVPASQYGSGNFIDPSTGEARLIPLELKRQLGVSYRSAWLLKHKIMQAMRLAETMGPQTFNEIAPLYGRSAQGQVPGLQQFQQMLESPALEARLQVFEDVLQKPIQSRAPWRRAQQLAHALRQHLGLSNEPIPTALLCDLFGLTPQAFESTLPPRRQPIAVAVPGPTGQIALHLRKIYPSARRFELARFIGDVLVTGSRPESWYVSSDIPTYRQKIQRAFAAEFLCPAEGAMEQLCGDYSEPAVEQVSERFGVSPEIVENLIANQEVTR
jgi:cyclophilin family peptidyl-prolyl cis-trans isomerase